MDNLQTKENLTYNDVYQHLMDLSPHNMKSMTKCTKPRKSGPAKPQTPLSNAPTAKSIIQRLNSLDILGIIAIS